MTKGLGQRLTSVEGKLAWATELVIAIKWFQFHQPKQVGTIRRGEKELALLKKEIAGLLMENGSYRSLQEAEDFVEAEIQSRFDRRLAEHEAKKKAESQESEPTEQRKPKGTTSRKRKSG